MIKPIQLSSYLVHYTKLSERLPTALDALKSVHLRPHIVKCWDGDRISENFATAFDGELWLERIEIIQHILNFNYLVNKCEVMSYKHYSCFGRFSPLLPSWMHPRQLRIGEQSVLMKHFYALSCIANGPHSFGLIAEDDIISTEESSYLFSNSFSELCKFSGDYLDLAGGCGLEPLIDSRCLHGQYVSQVIPASTRTNACYIISRGLAVELVNRFFPLVFPIDWHLLYLFQVLQPTRCFWSIKPAFIHGSEHGFVKSWRSDVF